ncbi:MAG: heavy metal-binding domain-containing protein [Myxococcota bacterium]
MMEFIGLWIVLGLLLIGYIAGRIAERRHYASIEVREFRFREMPTVTFERLDAWKAERSGLVYGSVVVSLDYFKRFVAGLRQIFGGRIQAYEPLLDRARREALLRMKEQAHNEGYDAVLNVRLETSRLASSGSDGKGTAGVEIVAFGTGIARAQ